MRGYLPTATVLVIVIAIAGCGSDDPVLSPACTENPASVRKALTKAPGPVTLIDGTTLSQCISNATGDADLQNVGIVFFGVAETLGDAASHGDSTAAVQLGYLVGATRRGASKTNGVMAELERRVERVGSVVASSRAAARSAVDRGRAAGEKTG